MFFLHWGFAYDEPLFVSYGTQAAGILSTDKYPAKSIAFALSSS